MIEPEFDRHRQPEKPKRPNKPRSFVPPNPEVSRPEVGTNIDSQSKKNTAIKNANEHLNDRGKQKIRQAKITEPAVAPIMNPVRVMCLALGISLFSLGLIGFVVRDLAQAHLSYWHNMIHVATGFGAVIVGYLGYQVSRYFSLVFGTVYGLLGVVGFMVGQRVIPGTGNLTEDSRLWVLRPEVLEFGTADHIIHICIAALFLFGAYLGSKSLRRNSRRA